MPAILRRCTSDHNDNGCESHIRIDLSQLRACKGRNHADRCVPIFLRMRTVPHCSPAEGGGLLRVLFLRLGQMPADSGTTRLLWLSLQPDGLIEVRVKQDAGCRGYGGYVACRVARLLTVA